MALYKCVLTDKLIAILNSKSYSRHNVTNVMHYTYRRYRDVQWVETYMIKPSRECNHVWRQHQLLFSRPCTAGQLLHSSS